MRGSVAGAVAVRKKTILFSVDRLNDAVYINDIVLEASAIWRCLRSEGQMATWAEKFEARQLRYAEEAKARMHDTSELDAYPLSEGLCYFIGWDGGLVKIGYSRNVSRRRGELAGTSAMYKLRIMATARGGRDREMHYHRLFRSASVGNEWFNLTPEIEAEIARLNQMEQAA